MDCKINVLNTDGECITGDKYSAMKCNAQAEPEVAEVEKPDYGIIEFGKYKGQEWIKLPSWYLEYLISEECKTSQPNKDKSAACLRLKKIVKGQLELRGLKK